MKRVLQAIWLAGLVLLAGCSKPEPLRIGFLAELTGRNADVAESQRNGLMIAIELHKQQGLLNGRDVEVVVRDTGSQVATARLAAENILSEKVDIVIGPVTSGMVDALLPTLTAHNTVLLTPSASAWKFYGHDDMLFRVNLTTRDNGRNYARHVYQRGIHQVAAAVNANNRAFSESWLEEFSAAYTAMGGRVVATEPFDSQSSNHTELVKRLLNAHPQGLLVIGNAVDTARLAQQTRKFNPTIPLIAAEWAGSDQLITLGGAAVEGLLIMQNFDQEDTSPVYQRFATLYRQRFGVNPVYGSVLAYDAATAALLALSKREPGMTPKQALLAYGPYPGLQQQVVFDANGDAQRGAYLMVVHNGRFNRAP